MLKAKIMDQMKEAMRARAQLRLDTLRYMLSEIKNAEIDAKVELDDNAVVAVLQKEVKKRKDGIEQMDAAGRDASEEKEKLAIIREFLPEEMSREAIEKIVDEVMAESSDRDFGKIMGMVMGKTKGQADGKLVGEVVRAKLA